MELQDLLRHIADNFENGREKLDGLDWRGSNAVRRVLTEPDAFKLKPRTHEVNGFTVPAPEVKMPKDLYFIPVIDEEYFCFASSWSDHIVDHLRMERGLIHLTKEAAIANAKAILGIDPYMEGEE